MESVFSTIKKVAATEASILILGENGTGKELVAREIHRQSTRAGKIFLGVDLGSLSQTLFESELFGHVKHQDIGQMNMYLNYFKAEENTNGDNSPIGIVLVADKNDILVEYALGGISNNIFVSKYQLYLPDRKVLEQKVKELIAE